jgi:hypothetical protein
MAPDGQHVTLAAGAPLDDGRIRVEIAAAWKSTEAARFELPGRVDDQPAGAGLVPSGPAAALAPILRTRTGGMSNSKAGRWPKPARVSPTSSPPAGSGTLRPAARRPRRRKRRSTTKATGGGSCAAAPATSMRLRRRRDV